MRFIRKVTEAMLRITGEKYWCMERYSIPCGNCSGPCACCADCGDHNLRELLLDHIDGGGCESRRKNCLGIGGHKYYAKLRRQGYPDEMDGSRFGVLCNECHKKKNKLDIQAKRLAALSNMPDSLPFDWSNPIPDVMPVPLWEGIE
jgi:hypothetical protein